jgi:hypothetical protein
MLGDVPRDYDIRALAASFTDVYHEHQSRLNSYEKPGHMEYVYSDPALNVEHPPHLTRLPAGVETIRMENWWVLANKFLHKKLKLRHEKALLMKLASITALRPWKSKGPVVPYQLTLYPPLSGYDDLYAERYVAIFDSMKYRFPDTNLEKMTVGRYSDSPNITLRARGMEYLRAQREIPPAKDFHDHEKKKIIIDLQPERWPLVLAKVFGLKVEDVEEDAAPLTPQLTELDLVESQIDAIEEKLMAYRREHPGGPKDMMAIAKLMGRGKEYDDLLRMRFKLEAGSRTNPGGKFDRHIRIEEYTSRLIYDKNGNVEDTESLDSDEVEFYSYSIEDFEDLDDLLDAAVDDLRQWGINDLSQERYSEGDTVYGYSTVTMDPVQSDIQYEKVAEIYDWPQAEGQELLDRFLNLMGRRVIKYDVTEEAGQLPAMTELDALQSAIDDIEIDIIRYRREHPEAPQDLLAVAKLMGRGKEYDALLRKRFELEPEMRTNPVEWGVVPERPIAEVDAFWHGRAMRREHQPWIDYKGVRYPMDEVAVHKGKIENYEIYEYWLYNYPIARVLYYPKHEERLLTFAIHPSHVGVSINRLRGIIKIGKELYPLSDLGTFVDEYDYDAGMGRVYWVRELRGQKIEVWPISTDINSALSMLIRPHIVDVEEPHPGKIQAPERGLVELEEEIDALETEILTYRREHPGSPRDLMAVAKLMGKGEEYDELLRKRYRLFDSRENPLPCGSRERKNPVLLKRKPRKVKPLIIERHSFEKVTKHGDVEELPSMAYNRYYDCTGDASKDVAEFLLREGVTATEGERYEGSSAYWIDVEDVYPGEPEPHVTYELIDFDDDFLDEVHLYLSLDENGVVSDVAEQMVRREVWLKKRAFDYFFGSKDWIDVDRSKTSMYSGREALDVYRDTYHFPSRFGIMHYEDTLIHETVSEIGSGEHRSREWQVHIDNWQVIASHEMDPPMLVLIQPIDAKYRPFWWKRVTEILAEAAERYRSQLLEELEVVWAQGDTYYMLEHKSGVGIRFGRKLEIPLGMSDEEAQEFLARFFIKDVPEEETPLEIEKSELMEVEEEIDNLERQMMAYRGEHPEAPKDMSKLAEAMGFGKKYDDLLRKRFGLEERENPLKMARGKRKTARERLGSRSTYRGFKGAKRGGGAPGLSGTPGMSGVLGSGISGSGTVLYGQDFTTSQASFDRGVRVTKHIYNEDGELEDSIPLSADKYPHVYDDNTPGWVRAAEDILTYRPIDLDDSSMPQTATFYTGIVKEEEFEGESGMRYEAEYIIEVEDWPEMDDLVEYVKKHMKAIDIEEETAPLAAPTGELAEVQARIDALEGEMMAYRREHPGAPSELHLLAKLIGKFKEYDGLLRQRYVLEHEEET